MVPIEKSAVKIVIFNNFKSMVLEFTNACNNFCMEIIHSGVSSLCICNYEWTNWLAINEVYMNVPKQSFELTFKIFIDFFNFIHDITQKRNHISVTSGYYSLEKQVA